MTESRESRTEPTTVTGDRRAYETPPYDDRPNRLNSILMWVAIVAGVRTPFAKAGSVLKNISSIDLGKLCVAELIQRSEIDGKLVEAIVYGTVVPSVVAPNIAREVSLLPMLPKGCQAFTVSRA